MAHQFHHGVASGSSNHQLSDARGTCSSGITINEESGTNDRAIAHAAMDLVGHATGSAGACQSPLRIHGHHPNGIVVLDVGNRCVLSGLQPLLPCIAHFRQVNIALGEAILQGPALSAGSDQHNVRCALHDRSGDADGMLEALHESNGSSTAIVILDACIQGDMAIAVWITAQAHAAIREITLHHHDTLLHRIEHAAAAIQHFPGTLIGGQSVIPCAQHNGTLSSLCGQSGILSCFSAIAASGHISGRACQSELYESPAVKVLCHRKCLGSAGNVGSHFACNGLPLQDMIRYLIWLLTPAMVGAAQPPPGYYDSAQGLYGEALRSALQQIISPHNVLVNSQLWAAFARADRKPNGDVWDIYSDSPDGTPPYTYQFVVDQCGTYNSEGDCFNREHTFPVSWFGDQSPMNTDLNHIYPTDAWVNQQRGNWPFATVASPTWTSANGGKRGPCSWPGCTGTVFEPIDAYKGDLARGHFYMLTRYMNESATWPAPILTSGQLVPWAKSLLIAWNEQDPVSDKERTRNDSMYVIQGNRNPYIDNPEWVNDIWGPEVSIREVSYSPVIVQLLNDELLVSFPEGWVNGTATITDASGREITRFRMSSGRASIPFPFAAGVYLLRTGTEPRAVRFIR